MLEVLGRRHKIQRKHLFPKTCYRVPLLLKEENSKGEICYFTGGMVS